jgi:hypothetical protein
MLNKFMHKIVTLATMVLTIAVAACSPQSNQGVSPNVAKESEQIPESQQEGYMRIIGALRWDELPNKEAWIKRFPGCFKDGPAHGVQTKFQDGFFKPLPSLPSACQINVSGFKIAPLYVGDEGKSARFTVQDVSFMLIEESQVRSFKEAIKLKYSEAYMDGMQAPRYCGEFTCWSFGDFNTVVAEPSPSVVSKLNTIGVDTSDL